MKNCWGWLPVLFVAVFWWGLLPWIPFDPRRHWATFEEELLTFWWKKVNKISKQVGQHRLFFNRFDTGSKVLIVTISFDLWKTVIYLWLLALTVNCYLFPQKSQVTPSFLLKVTERIELGTRTLVRLLLHLSHFENCFRNVGEEVSDLKSSTSSSASILIDFVPSWKWILSEWEIKLCFKKINFNFTVNWNKNTESFF